MFNTSILSTVHKNASRFTPIINWMQPKNKVILNYHMTYGIVYIMSNVKQTVKGI